MLVWCYLDECFELRRCVLFSLFPGGDQMYQGGDAFPQAVVWAFSQLFLAAIPAASALTHASGRWQTIPIKTFLSTRDETMWPFQVPQ